MERFIKMYSSEDFAEQILSILPPKSLMRFKCVCQSWCNLIKSHSFVAKHISTCTRASSLPILFKRQIPLTDKDNNPKDEDEKKEAENDDEKESEDDDDNVEILLSSLNICNENDDDCLLSTVVQDLNIPIPASLKLRSSLDLIIQGHCDGIICLKLFMGNVILCNPGMHEFKLIPKSFLILPTDVDICPDTLEYFLKDFTEYLGFGYDPKGKDYKIVRIVNFDEVHYWSRAEVYTMKSNSWREIDTLYDPQLMHHIDHWNSFLPIYLNGICYWRVVLEDRIILSFDMSSELFHEIPMPDFEDECKTRTHLAVWKEFIALFNFHEELGGHQFYDMWVMLDDLGEGGKGSWTKHLTLGPVEGVQSPLIFWKSDQLLFVTDDGQIVVYNIGTQKVVYNIGTQKLKYLPIQLVRSSCRYLHHDQALVYVNSIVPIYGGDTLEDINTTAFYGSGKFYPNVYL